MANNTIPIFRRFSIMMKNINRISDLMSKRFFFKNWLVSVIFPALVVCLNPTSTQCVRTIELEEVVIEDQKNTLINLLEISEEDDKNTESLNNLSLSEKVHQLLSNMHGETRYKGKATRDEALRVLCQ